MNLIIKRCECQTISAGNEKTGDKNKMRVCLPGRAYMLEPAREIHVLMFIESEKANEERKRETRMITDMALQYPGSV
ncbi:hypothetical protein RUM43_005069 [Polyplax serrata]|uniref:Uncharacterized protein n=1 Tax=Polyplax serrata TaxID=468196 RepID=A0AAN8SCJ1_POLSC